MAFYLAVSFYSVALPPARKGGQMDRGLVVVLD